MEIKGLSADSFASVEKKGVALAKFQRKGIRGQRLFDVAQISLEKEKR
jgi:hypothetical protein